MPEPITYLIKICKYLNVSADYILGFTKGEEWKKEIIVAILEGFIVSIWKGILNIKVDDIEISSETVEYYIVKYTHFTFNILDIFARILIGFLLVGYWGILAILTCNKYISYHVVLIKFKNNKRSLVKINDKILKQISEKII